MRSPDPSLPQPQHESLVSKSAYLIDALDPASSDKALPNNEQIMTLVSRQPVAQSPRTAAN
jgi:hypothetical protein